MSEGRATYESSGVSIQEQERAIRSFRDAVRATFTPGVLSDVGSFGGLFAASFPGVEAPVLVSSIDGVGTKTRIARMAGRYGGLGRDIVAHCINDILVLGARPLFFLDYFAAAKLSADAVSQVVASAAEACIENGCALIGGETAEMPGVYEAGELDVVGCVVGVVERSKVLPRDDVEPGDAIIGLASSGLHTNGFSLARKALFEVGKRELTDSLAGDLLAPHRCYFRPLWPLLEAGDHVKALAHITGGGLLDNLPRVFRSDLSALIERRSWETPRIFSEIQEAGGVPDDEMLRAFNMGIGMAIICASEHAGRLRQELADSGETPYLIGEITRGGHEVRIV